MPVNRFTDSGLGVGLSIFRKALHEFKPKPGSTIFYFLPQEFADTLLLINQTIRMTIIQNGMSTIQRLDQINGRCYVSQEVYMQQALSINTWQTRQMTMLIEKVHGLLMLVFVGILPSE